MLDAVDNPDAGRATGEIILAHLVDGAMDRQLLLDGELSSTVDRARRLVELLELLWKEPDAAEFIGK
ncbi:unnamed protein product [Protopolystoma xenopodis]|uniref:Uncharacterized protein n=1 Tax=Protopolystoma xenopodis TaxID=117903 RepID=A0A448XK48_9PLAT|nr:unnamed protein product [Protopolystoma xenopodis]